MDYFIEWVVIHGAEIIGCIIGIYCLMILINVEHDLKILLLELTDSNKGIQKLTNSLMGSLNEIRKFLNHQRKER